MSVGSVMYLDTETGVHEARFKAWQKTHPVKPKANLVDPDKIKADIATKTRAARMDAATNHFSNEIKVVSWVMDDDDDKSVRSAVNSGLNGAECMQTVAAIMQEVQTVVGFNSSSCDIPWLRSAMIQYGVRLPYVLRPEPRYRMQRLVDIRMVLTEFDRYGRGKLEDWCRLFGVAGPNPHSGEDIERMIAAKDWPGLKTTCQQDVLATRRLHNRMHELNWI